MGTIFYSILKNLKLVLAWLLTIVLTFTLIVYILNFFEIDSLWITWIALIGATLISYKIIGVLREKYEWEEQERIEEENKIREKNEREEQKRIEEENKIREQERLEREKKEKELRRKKDFWFELDGFETERELNKVFEKLGYKTKLTPLSNDEGLDHILDGEIVVQTKNTKRKSPRTDLQKFRGSMKDYKKGIFVSINGFTNTCEEYVLTNDRQILLYDVNDVIGMSEGKKPEWNE